jgi:hypothetical protein
MPAYNYRDLNLKPPSLIYTYYFRLNPWWNPFHVALLASALLQMCHAGGVAGSGSVEMYHADGVASSGSITNVSCGWCCWRWQCYKCVPRVVLLALAGLQMCQAGGVAGSGSVENVSRRWCC